MSEIYEGNSTIEQRERPKARSIEIIMVRHGKQEEYTDPQSELSQEGEEAARAFGETFVDQHLSEEVIVKIKRSVVQRASRSADFIEEGIRSAIERRGLTNIKLLNTREEAGLRTTGALGPVMKAGVPYERVVDTWLTHADQYPDAKTPEIAASEVRSLVDRTTRLREKLSPEGPSVAYIWVTHETAHASLLRDLTGKTTEELGGGIGHLEPLTIKISEQEPVTIQFRGQEYVYKQANENESTG